MDNLKKPSNIKKEIYRYLVILFALGFFIFPLFGSDEGEGLWVGLAFLSVFIACFLAIWGGKKDLYPDSVKMRIEWFYQGMPVFWLPLSYGFGIISMLAGVLMGILKRYDMMAVFLILGLLLILLTNYVKRKTKTPKGYW